MIFFIIKLTLKVMSGFKQCRFLNKYEIRDENRWETNDFTEYHLVMINNNKSHFNI